jgi:hypothetical protein
LNSNSITPKAHIKPLVVNSPWIDANSCQGIKIRDKYNGVLTNRIKARIKKKFEFAILKVSARIPLMFIVRCGDDSVMPDFIGL